METTKDQSNYLNQVSQVLREMPTLFRDRICQECNWSIPTYYRKRNLKNRIHPVTIKVYHALSNAEMEKINAVVQEMVTTITEENNACSRKYMYKVTL